MKKQKQLLIILISIIFIFGFTIFKLPDNFQKLMERAKMTFDSPENMIEVPIHENGDMNYEYSLKYPNKNFEVRYSIRPMDYLIKMKKESDKNPNETMINPNNIYKIVFEATLLNISKNKIQDPQYGEFSTIAVGKEFNADWGASAYIETSETFGNGYKHCLAVTIHKNNIGDAYIFYMMDDTTRHNFDSLKNPFFHSLKFKKD